MVLIDTSVWISLYRKQDQSTGQLLWRMANRNEAAICGQVWVEFLGGFRNKTIRSKYEELLGEYQWLETNKEMYKLAAHWLAEYPKLGAGDATIAACAYVSNCELLTFDKDFQLLKRKGLVLAEPT